MLAEPSVTWNLLDCKKCAAAIAGSDAERGFSCLEAALLTAGVTYMVLYECVLGNLLSYLLASNVVCD